MRREGGETLVELLFAVVLMAGAGTIFLTGLAGAAASSGLQAASASAHTALVALAARVAETPHQPCATSSDWAAALDLGPPPAGQPALAVQAVTGWNGASYDPRQAALRASADSDATTLAVDSPAALPSGGPYQVLVGGAEVMTVTGGYGTTDLVVERGAGPVAHPAGETVLVCPRVQRLDLVATTPDGRRETLVATSSGPLRQPFLLGRVPAPGARTDTAVLTGSRQSTGTLVFALHGPADTTCAGPPVFTSSTAVTGDQTYESAPVPASATAVPGTYRWIVSWAGDPSHAPVRGGCDEPEQRVELP